MAEQLPDTYYRTPFKFNGKELDEETGLYYYGARYYDPKISIWLSVDPLAEKYVSINPYVYCVQNPINIIDPDGRDIIFLNKLGGVTKVVIDGKSNITINDQGVIKTFADYNISGSLFSWNNRNRQVVANIAGYYAKKVGISKIWATWDDMDGALAHTTADNRIFVGPNKSGYLDNILNNKYNLMSTIEHEKFHVEEENGGSYTYSMHSNVYLKQFKTDTFLKTSKDFAEGVMVSFMDYLNGAKRNNESGWESILKDFNSSEIRGGYKIYPRNSGGWQLFNNKGQEVNTPLREQQSSPY